jgi:hypothetical protein
MSFLRLVTRWLSELGDGLNLRQSGAMAIARIR